MDKPIVCCEELNVPRCIDSVVACNLEVKQICLLVYFTTAVITSISDIAVVQTQ